MNQITIIHLYEPGETQEEVFHEAFHPTGHTHKWEPCRHDGVGSQGSHMACTKRSTYRLLTHDICFVCGCDRHTNNWGEIAWQELVCRAELLGISEEMLSSGEFVIFPKLMAEDLQ